jgi:hypothetical protein
MRIAKLETVHSIAHQITHAHFIWKTSKSFPVLNTAMDRKARETTLHVVQRCVGPSLFVPRAIVRETIDCKVEQEKR